MRTPLTLVVWCVVAVLTLSLAVASCDAQAQSGQAALVGGSSCTTTACRSKKFTSTGDAGTDGVLLQEGQCVSWSTTPKLKLCKSGGSLVVTGAATVDVQGADAGVVNTAASQPVRVLDGDGLAVACVEVLPTCNAARAYALLPLCATLAYNYCDGSSWREVAADATQTFDAYVASSTEEEAVASRRASSAGRVESLSFVVQSPAVGAGSAVLSVVDASDDRELCLLTFSCTQAAGTTALTDACAVTYEAGVDIVIRWAGASNCTGLPQGNASAVLRE